MNWLTNGVELVVLEKNNQYGNPQFDFYWSPND